jgi:hypothetical protein
MKKICLLIMGVSLQLLALGQGQQWPLSISVFNNATALPPGVITSLVSEPLHPGFTIGTAYKYNNSVQHELFQTVKLGYFYHRYSQHAIQFYTETGYRYNTRYGLDFGPLLGGGYLHSVPATQVFELNNAGEYAKRASIGRPQAMVSTALEVGYSTARLTQRPLRFFMTYQFWLQFPFVKQYVPLLPSTALHAGVSFPLSK